MSPSVSRAVTEEAVSLPPVLCLTCLSYLNLYATFDATTGVWTCPICNSENVAPKDIFGAEATVSPALVSPIVEYRQSLKGMEDSSSYILVMDANLPSHEAHAVAQSIERLLLEEVRSTGRTLRLALLTFDKTVSIYQLGLTGFVASADVILPGQDEDDVEGYLELRNRMPDRLYFCDIVTEASFSTFDSCISAVFGMHTPCSPKPNLSRKEMLRRKREARMQGQTEVKVESPWVSARSNHSTRSIKETSRPPRCTGEALQYAADVASFATTARTSRILLFTNGCPNKGRGNIVRPDNQLNNKIAADVIDHVAMVGAVKYFEAIGKDAIESRIGIDVFLSGAGNLGLQAYQACVDPSGGYALPHESLASPQFEFNLKYVLSQTYVSRSDKNTNKDSSASSSMNEIDGCIVDVRMSEFITPSHVVGAMEVINLSDGSVLLPNERSAFAIGASLAAKHGLVTNNLPSEDQVADTLTRVRMGRYDPLSTLSFMLTVEDNIASGEDKDAFFQCTIRYLEQDGKTLVTVVSTHRLPLAKSVHDFLDSMDEEVIPVVLGKEAVFRSIVGREDEEAIDALVADSDRVEMLAYEAQKDLDNTVHRVSGAYRLIGLEVGTNHRDFVEEGGVSSAHSSLGFAFPPELADALHRLFHLRRGSMLSPGPVRSMDDRAEIRNLFLRLPLDDCLCMMAPSLWSSGIVGSSNSLALNPIPSDTMTLWDNVSEAAATNLVQIGPVCLFA